MLLLTVGLSTTKLCLTTSTDPTPRPPRCEGLHAVHASTHLQPLFQALQLCHSCLDAAAAAAVPISCCCFGLHTTHTSRVDTIAVSGKDQQAGVHWGHMAPVHRVLTAAAMFKQISTTRGPLTYAASALGTLFDRTTAIARGMVSSRAPRQRAVPIASTHSLFCVALRLQAHILSAIAAAAIPPSQPTTHPCIA